MSPNNNLQGPRIQRHPRKKHGDKNPPRKSGVPDYGDRPDLLPTVEDNARETENPTQKQTMAGE